MTAQIDLPQDFAEENTIIISDDTVVEHHTLRDWTRIFSDLAVSTEGEMWDLVLCREH